MREREENILIKKLDEIEYEKCGGSLYLRLLESDEKKIEDLAKLSGEKRSVIAQKLIHAALSDQKINLGPGKLESKVDGLVRNDRETRFALEEILHRVYDVDDRLRNVEEKLETSAEHRQNSTAILRELFCMLNVALSSIDFTLSKLVEYISPNEFERKNSRLVADTVNVNLIEYSIRDLARCLSFHNIDFDENLAKELYITTKMKT